MSGTLAPDFTGTYDTVGWYESKGYAQQVPAAKHLWWDGTDTWYLSVVPGTPGGAYWIRNDPSIVGDYTPQGTATGTATVVEA